MALVDPQIAYIAVAVITAAGTYFTYRQSNQNAQDIRPIKEVLAASPGASSLDGVIKILQSELHQTSQRHESEIKYMSIQIEELRNALGHCQHERSNLTIKYEEMAKLLKQHELKLNGK